MSSHGSASALPETVRPVDWLLAAYNGTLAVLWAGLWDRAWYALPVATAHAAAACLPALLARLPRNTPRPLGLLREAYPLLWIPGLWLGLGPLIAGLHEATIDPSILALDLAVFGVHLDRVWMPAMPQMWFSEIMHFAYYAYLPLIFLPPIVLLARGRTPAFRDMTLRLIATYLFCYLFYLALPTVGPHEFGQPFQGGLSDGFFYQLGAGAHSSGNVRGAAFPSSHVAGAVTIAWVAWRWLPRSVAVLLTIEAVGVMMSTVYTQNHYGVDSIAGLAWALLIQLWVVPLLLRRRAPSTKRTAGRLAPSRIPLMDVTTGGGS
jgi:membrane-associated phospholipid phosphatase